MGMGMRKEHPKFPSRLHRHPCDDGAVDDQQHIRGASLFGGYPHHSTRITFAISDFSPLVCVWCGLVRGRSLGHDLAPTSKHVSGPDSEEEKIEDKVAPHALTRPQDQWSMTASERESIDRSKGHPRGELRMTSSRIEPLPKPKRDGDDCHYDGDWDNANSNKYTSLTHSQHVR
jgi:hypothetical protein